MRSSSDLFPVSLIAAETLEGFDDDGYLLHPGVSSDPSVRIGVSRVSSQPRDRHAPVVLLHPEFQNRYHWLKGQHLGFAGELLAENFDVWLPEMRGHGRSPRNHTWAAGSLLTMGYEDWWSVQRFVQEQSDGQSPVWVAQGMGALSLLHALAKKPEMANAMAALILIEPGTPDEHWLGSNLSTRQRWQLRRRPAFGGPWGPELEPSALVQEVLEWRSSRKQPDQHPVFHRLPMSLPPVLSVSLGNDDAVRALAAQLPGTPSDVLVPADVGATLTAGVPACDVPIEPLRLEMRQWLARQGVSPSFSGSEAMNVL